MARTFTGTLIGPHGERVGQYVSFEDYHNETQTMKGLIVRLMVDGWSALSPLEREALALITQDLKRMGQDNLRMASAVPAKVDLKAFAEDADELMRKHGFTPMGGSEV